MTTFTITDIEPTLGSLENKLTAITFTISGTDGRGNTASYTQTEILDAAVSPAGAEFTADELMSECQKVADLRGLQARLNQDLLVQKTPGFTPPVVPVLSDADVRAQLSLQVDFTARDLYSRFTAFQLEYDPREQAARNYRAAGYSGDPTQWVTDFTSAAGISVRDGVDKIIAQADVLRAAIQQLAALRMQKYGILNAPDLDAARARGAQIVADITTLGNSLP